jgi:hypothetical protein
MPVGDQLDDGSDKKVVAKVKADDRPVSLLYLIGLDDVGHHDISPVLSTIAGSCDYHVEFKSPAIQSIMRIQDPSEIDKQLSLYLRKVAETSVAQKTKTIIIDQLILPRSGILSNSTVEMESAESTYTLRKMFKRGQKEDVNMKFLYLKRDFYDNVASYFKRSGGSFEDRAKNMQSLIRYLGSEHAATTNKGIDPWAAVHYEWFAKVKDCRVLVSAIIDFAGWDRCDVEYACQALKTATFTATKPPVVEADHKLAQTVNVDTDIPVLELWQDRKFQFTPWKVPARPPPGRVVIAGTTLPAPRAVQRILPEQHSAPPRRSIEPAFDRRTMRSNPLEARLRGPHLRRVP